MSEEQAVWSSGNNGPVDTGQKDTAQAEIEQTGNDQESEEFANRVGYLVRTLRESMRELGLEESVAKVAEAIPDARGRLEYIVISTERAADRSLNAVDRARPVQEKLEAESKELAAKWQHWFGQDPEKEAIKSLILDTRAFLEDIPEKAGVIGSELTEITMAQDFQDLTGQVIKKLMELVVRIEHQLLDLLVDSVYPEEGREEVRKRISANNNPDESSDDSRGTLTNGPQIDPAASDALSSQDQVDDLLDELGF